MKKEIELIEKLNSIKQQRLNPIKDLSIFFKLYFRNIKVFKLEVFLKPALTFCLIIFLTSSFGVYSYASNKIVYGNPLYQVKTRIENTILATKKTQEDKINYYAKLIDRRLLEIDYLETKNFDKEIISFSIVKEVYAESVDDKNYSSSIAKTMSEILVLNEKIDIEFSNIKDDKIKERVSKIIKEKEDKQIKIFTKIQNKNKLLKDSNKIKKEISDEIDNVVNKKLKKENIIEKQEIKQEIKNTIKEEKEDIKENKIKQERKNIKNKPKNN